MKLYEISEQYRSLLANMVDEETGEINAETMGELDSLETDFNDKIISIASMIKNLEAERNAIEEARKNMAIREKRLEKIIDSMTSYARDNMVSLDKKKISCPYFDINIKMCPIGTYISDESLLPKEYIKIKEVLSVDKLRIKDDLMSGYVVPGAQLHQNVRLEIK